MRPLRPLLGATMIVRDEEHDLPDCLAGLGGVVDEIVVHDTGSVDGTREIARRAGARVLAGSWEGDFARARNVALAQARTEWVLVVDADERLVADAHLLRRLLLGSVEHSPPVRAVDAFLLPVVQLGTGDAEDAEPVVTFSTRLFRADRGRWRGRVHEAVALPEGAVRCLLPATVAFIEHRGYADPAAVRAKAARNLALAQSELDELVATGSDDRETGARVLLDIARSFLATGRRQPAVDALEALREIVDGGVHRAVGTGLLAQVLLDAGGFEEVVLGLADELRTGGLADRRQVDWLRAQALTALGDLDAARALVEGIDRVLDPAGTPLPIVPLRRLRSRLQVAR